MLGYARFRHTLSEDRKEDRKMEHITVKEILEATGGRLLCGSADTPLDHLSIDSRTMKGNDLFVPLVGEKVDAHRFIGQAFDNGAAATFTSEHDVITGHGSAWLIQRGHYRPWAPGTDAA